MKRILLLLGFVLAAVTLAEGGERLNPAPVFSTTEVYPTTFETGPDPEVVFAGDKMFFFGGLKGVARAFRENTGIDVGLYGFGCMLGGEHLVAGHASLAGQCRAQSAPHEEKARLQRVPVARYTLEVFAHPSNPIENLTLEQLDKINRAEITNWKELGGADAPIIVVEATHCYCKHPQNGDTQRGPELLRTPKDEFTPNRIKTYSQKVLVDLVAMIPNAIAGEKSPYVEPERNRVKILKVEGVPPTRENIRSGRYPVSRELDLLLRPDADEKTKRFVEFTRGAAGQAVLENSLLIPYP